MAVYILKRVGLALITLWILSMIIFWVGQQLPGDPGRTILGNLATPAGVAALDHKLGVDRSIVTQYTDWVTNLAHGDMGTSYSFQAPIRPFITTALVNSLKLALVAFFMCVPLAIASGVIAALKSGQWIDRSISVFGLSLLGLPEFVSGVFLIMIFGIWLNVLPVGATPPAGAGPFTQVYHLILPAIAIACVLFGYIMRMARAGTIEALNSDYTRTAVLKGLPTRTVVWRHVLRNALLPTITVVATQVGYLIGGLLVVEYLFHYNGIGSLTFKAAQAKDFPLLEATVLTIGVVYLVATLIADIIYTLLNPRLRIGGDK
jgi:peptide/nickel transport system permease protein